MLNLCGKAKLILFFFFSRLKLNTLHTWKFLWMSGIYCNIGRQPSTVTWWGCNAYIKNMDTSLHKCMHLLALQPSSLLYDLVSSRRVQIHRGVTVHWDVSHFTQNPPWNDCPTDRPGGQVTFRGHWSLALYPWTGAFHCSFLTACIEPLVFVHQKGASKQNVCFVCLLCFCVSRACEWVYLCAYIYSQDPAFQNTFVWIPSI